MQRRYRRAALHRGFDAPAEAARTAVSALVGLRRNLFPDSPALQGATP